MATAITSNGNVHTITGLTASEVSDALPLTKLGGAVGAVAASGTWGGGTVTIEVSLDGTNWFTLKDVTGTTMSFGADGYGDFSTAANWVRASANSSVALVDVAFVVRN